MLSRKKKLHLTSASSLLLQLFSMAFGFILPRLFLEYYGSAVNGLVSSITQFLGFIALAECGIGAVIQSALYRPLAQNDSQSISRIVISAERFFRGIAKLLLLYTIVLFFLYPYFACRYFNFIYTASLVLIISISFFAQYYFGVTYRLLLTADQFGFVPILVQIVALSLNFVFSVVLIHAGASIHVVKFVSSCVFLLQPLSISFIAHRWYKIDRKVFVEKNTIPQKWNGLAQHISAVVLQSSGVVVLTLFSSLENISVYAIYNLVVQGVRNLIMSMTNGMQAFLGNLFSKGDLRSFVNSFENFERKIHFTVSIIFSITASLIVPFVGVYTKGIEDVNYILPLFGLVFTCGWGGYCIRLPYNIVVLSVGHYKQTQKSAIIEAVLNLLVSSILVINFGVIGVAFGTLIAMIYRTCYLAWYISRNVINRSLWVFFKHFVVDVVSFFLFFVVLHKFFSYSIWYDVSTAPATYASWFWLAAKYSIICFVVITCVNVFVYGKYVSGLISIIRSWIQRRWKC